MSTRLKVWLAYPALIVFVFALINFGLFFVNGTSPVSIFISHPLGMLAGGYLAFAFLLPAMFGRQSGSRALPPAGPALATQRCAGRVGRMIFDDRSIRVAVHPDRLTLRAFPMGEYTIHGSEILSVATDESGWRGKVVIEHAAPGQASPVVLASPSDQLCWAISQIQRDPVAGLAQPSVPESPADKAARRIAWNVTSIMYVTGLVMSLGFVGLGLTQSFRTRYLFPAVFVVVGLLSGYQCARALINHARQD